MRLTYKFRVVILPNTFPLMELGISTEIFRNDLLTAVLDHQLLGQFCIKTNIIVGLKYYLVKRQALWNMPTEHINPITQKAGLQH